MHDMPLKVNTEQAERLHRFAHDIRNRLGGMRQVLQQLQEPGPDTDANELITFGERQFFKALREVEVLLDELGVDRNVIISERATVQFADVVREAYGHVAYRFERKEQRPVMELAEKVTVLADRHVLCELVTALLTNACKYTPRQGLITVRLNVVDAFAELEVIDAGVGLSPADQQHIFVRYAWLESRSTDGEPQGRSTLARAAQWAGALGGSLVAGSDGAGKGSRFTLRLPLGA